jgi:hypothetical protein
MYFVLIVLGSIGAVAVVTMISVLVAYGMRPMFQWASTIKIQLKMLV